MRTLAAVLITMLAFSACGDDDMTPNPKPTPSPSTTASPRSPTVTPLGPSATTDSSATLPTTCENVLEGRSTLNSSVDQIAITAFGDDICWRAVKGATSYALETTVAYYPNCEAWHSGGVLTLNIVDNPILPGNLTSWHLTQTLDPRYEHAKDISVTIHAFGSGATGAVGRFSVQREIDLPGVCGTAPPTRTPSSPSGPIP